MSSALSSVTIKSAPRDIAHLSNIGRFQLRRLAEELGILSDEQKKASFMAATLDDMTKTVHAALKTYDQQHTNGAGVEEAPAQAAVESPPAVEAAPKREPRTQRQPESAPVQAPVTVAPAVDYSKIMEIVTATLSRQSEEINTKRAKDTDELKAKLDGILQFQRYQVCLSLLLAEQVLGGSTRLDVLRAAVEDSQGLAALLGKVSEAIKESLELQASGGKGK